MVTWNKEDSVSFLKGIISNDVPVVIKGLPVALFKLFELDLMKLSYVKVDAKEGESAGSQQGGGLDLNFIQWQNHQVFIASHEREKGNLYSCPQNIADNT